MRRRRCMRWIIIGAVVFVRKGSGKAWRYETFKRSPLRPDVTRRNTTL